VKRAEPGLEEEEINESRLEELKRRFRRGALMVVLVIMAVAMLFPFFWMLWVALKEEGHAFTFDFSWAKPLFSNFASVWKNPDYPFGKFFLNSLVVATAGGAVTALMCSMGAYVFAKKDFAGKEPLFWTLLATMMVPGMVYLVPQFALVSTFRWVNTYQGMFVPHLASVWGLFLLRQYMETLPDSVIEQAKIDGAGDWRIFFTFVVPLSMPVIATVFLITFLFHWNNFLWQLVVNTPDSPLLTLPVGLALFRGQYTTEWTKLMAASAFSIVPIAIIFGFAQRFFIQGMTVGALKE